jgi:hypothetical protein
MTDKVKPQRSEPVNSPEVRIAYPWIHDKRKKKTPNGEKALFEATLLFPKLSADPAQCANYKFLSDLCMAAAGKMWPGIGWPQGGQWPVKDGDVPLTSKPKPGVAPKTAEQVAAANAWRVGHWTIEVSSYLDTGPRVAVIQNGQAIDLPAKVINGVAMYKSGDYGIVNLHAWAYQNETFGVNFGFDGVLFTRPGEAIGSSGPKTAAQMFAGIATFGSAPAGGPPVPPATAPAPAPVVTAPAPPAPVAVAPQPPAPPAPVAAPGIPPAAPTPTPAPAGVALPPLPVR